MEKKLSVFNLVSVLLVIGMSYYSQAVTLNGNTIGSLSEDYYNLFTPAGYAFAIWGIIYIALIAYAIFQVRNAFKEGGETWFITKTGPWFIIANVANAAWVVAWLYEYTGLSVILMFIILISLIKIILNTNMERWDAPLKIIAFTWWPICLYSGWIAVATIANVSAYLAKLGWDGWFFNEVQWTMFMIVVATAVNIVIVFTRNMREFALVGIWALVAIYFRHFEEIPVISYTALIASISIFSVVTWHAWKNRDTNPFRKYFNKE